MGETRAAADTAGRTFEPRRSPTLAAPELRADVDGAHQVGEGDAVSPTVGPIARVPAATRVGQLLRLQRVVGNRAVQRRLAAGRVAPASGLTLGSALQRYDAHEHATAGDAARGGTNVTITPVELTPGEINALADLYGTPDDLLRADPAELTRLRDLVRKQKADPSSVTEADWDAASGGRYTKLNLKNSAHFAPQNAALAAPQPGTAAGVDNRAMFTKYYLEAIEFAVKANLPVAPGAKAAQFREFSQKAHLWLAFGEHYLLDAFSAGHLFNKDDVLGLISSGLGGLSEKALSGLLGSAASAVWARRSAFIGRYQAKAYWAWWDLNSADRFKSLLEGIYETDEGKAAVGSAVVKAAHDRLDTRDAGGGKIGVPVENDFGSWVLSGDKTLKTSPETQRWMQLALEEARSTLQATLTAAVAKSDPALLSKVLAYLPRPTAESTAMIAALIKDVTDPKAGMSGAIAEVMGGELEALFEALEKRKFIRKKP